MIFYHPDGLPDLPPGITKEKRRPPGPKERSLGDDGYRAGRTAGADAGKGAPAPMNSGPPVGTEGGVKMLVEKASVRRLLPERSTNGLGHRLFPPATSIIHPVLKENLKTPSCPKNSDFHHISVTFFLFGKKERSKEKPRRQHGPSDGVHPGS